MENKYMKKILLKKSLVIILSTMFMVACVGTVKDKNSKLGNITTDTSTSNEIPFTGLSKANPVSHNKIELFFLPAKGDQNMLSYEIYVNGSPVPIKIDGNTLTLTASGLCRTVVTGLSTNTSYSFNMKVKEVGGVSSSLLDPSKSLTAKTFSNETADFLGISSVTLGSGSAGKNTVIVKWLPAKTEGFEIAPKPNDPVGYEVTYISQLGGSGNLNTPGYNGLDRVTIKEPTTPSSSILSKLTEKTISGLSPGVVFFF
jgi:hypothetical protein